MSTSIYGIFAAVLVLGFLVLAALGFSAHLYAISELTGGTFGSHMKTYSSFDWGFSVKYPSDFSVNDSYMYAGLGHERQIRGVSFTIPPDKIEGTNLSPDTRFSVEVMPNVPNCSARLFMASASKVRAYAEDGVGYSEIVRMNRGAGSTYEEHVYALLQSSPCVAIRYYIHSTNITSYTPENIQPFDREDLLAVFDAMKKSVSVREQPLAAY